MSSFTDWRDGVEKKVTDMVSPSSNGGQPSTTQGSGGILEAIYQYGRGQKDTAIQTLTKAFRGTSAGKQLEAEATRQKITELMPYIIMGVLAIIVGSYYAFRR